MYNKIIKKYYILKLFCFCMPVSKNIKKINFHFCKFIAQNTPYGDIFNFIKELYKIILVNKNSSINSKFVLSATNSKIFVMTLYYKKNLKQLKKQPLNLNTFLIVCGDNYKSKQIAFFKDQKIPSIGFINFSEISQITDYTLLLQSKYFSSTFLIYYFIKRLLKNDTY